MGLRLCRGLSKFVSQIRKTPLVKHKVGATVLVTQKDKRPHLRENIRILAQPSGSSTFHTSLHTDRRNPGACQLYVTTATFKHTKDTARSYINVSNIAGNRSELMACACAVIDSGAGLSSILCACIGAFLSNKFFFGAYVQLTIQLTLQLICTHTIHSPHLTYQLSRTK